MPSTKKRRRSRSPEDNDRASDDFSESSAVSSAVSEKFPEAFVHAIRRRSIAGLSSDGGFSVVSSEYESVCSADGSESSTSVAMLKRGSLIPESVIATLTNVQRSQLRRIREEASQNLESILRNVVKTVDQYYVDQKPLELYTAKKMIGTDVEEEEEKRIKAEVKRILQGDMKSKQEAAMKKAQAAATRRMTVVTFPPDKLVRPAIPEKQVAKIDGEKGQDEGKEKIAVTKSGTEEKPQVCDVMLKFIDDLEVIADQRETVLNEILEWMESYPPDSIPDLSERPRDSFDYDENIFQNWSVHKNIRRLSRLSEEMGLATAEDGGDAEKTGDQRKKILEEKMNTQRSKYIATRVFDAENLTEPKNWNSASRAIAQVLEEAASSSTNQRAKQTFLNAQKQFRFMSSLAEKRQEEKLKLSLQVNDLNGKLNKEKKEAKSLRKTKQTLECQVERQEDDIVELKKEIETRDRMIAEQTAQIYELEIMQEEKEREAESYQAAQSIPRQAQSEQTQQQGSAPDEVAEKKSKSKESAAIAKKPSKSKASKPAKPKGQQQAQGGKSQKDTKEAEKRAKQEREKEKEREEARRTSVVMSLKEAKAELEEIKKAGKIREEKVKELKLKLESEAAKSEQEQQKLHEEIQLYKTQTESAKKQLEMEKETWERMKSEMTQERNKLANEVQAKEEIINYQEQRIQEVAREMTLSLMRAGLQAGSGAGRGIATDKLMESKQMLAKLHLQYEYEMQKLREFVDRESERHQAEMRRMEQEHKRDLQIIYRDTSVILRAVNRFKECLAALLDRENLADAAFDIRKLPNLCDDETTTDPHLKLARMAGNVTELMIQMEFKMSQALMNKRMEIKDTSLAKNFLNKDLEAREELLKKARELGNLQAEKLKQVREELTSQEVEFLKMKQSEEDKFLDLNERNKDLTRQNQILNKELTFLRKELEEETAKRTSQKEEVEKMNGELKRRLEEQEVVMANLKAENMRILGEQKMHLKRTDMLRNLKLLNDALAAKKLSQEKHMIAVSMVEKTMEVSGLRFVHFVRKYVLHRNWKKICEAMKEYHKNSKIKRPPKVERYLKNVEKRMEEKKSKWNERKDELLKTKTEVYLHFRNMCNALNKEHGVHLIRPTVQRVYSAVSLPQVHDQEWPIGKKPYHQAKKPTRQVAQTDNIAEVKGFKFLAPPSESETSWAFPPINTTQSSIVTPKILDMDINKARETGQRVLTSKSCGNIDNENGSGFKRLPWYQRLKERQAVFGLPPIATLYPEN